MCHEAGISDGTRRLFGEELETRLDEVLFASHSHRSATDIALGLEALTRAQQERVLHWAAVAAGTYAEIGYQIAVFAPKAFSLTDDAGFDAWVLAGLDAYDRHGGRAAMNLLRNIEGFCAGRNGMRPVAKFPDIEARLTRFIHGLSGRPLGLAVGACAWTDTETIFLPAEQDSQPGLAANRQLYKVQAVILWAQTRFGTFGRAAVDLEQALAPWLDTGDQDRCLRWLAALESMRLEARIASELPGLASEIAAVRGPWPTALQPFLPRLFQPQATLSDTLELLPGCLLGSEDAPHLPHAVLLDPAAAQRVRGLRIARDMKTVSRAISALKAIAGTAGRDQSNDSDESTPALAAEGDAQQGSEGEALALPPEARAAAQSLVQDLGEVPPECLVPAGPGPWQPTEFDSREQSAGEDYVSHREPDHRYDEWDYRRRAYRKEWCHLFESDVAPGDPAYVSAIRLRHAGLIKQIRRRFEMLRGEDRMLGRQPEGEEVDLDAVVDAIADRRGGVEPSSRLFSRRIRNQRSLAAMFMVDMSGSTKGWVNEAEREALVMLCEAIESLGDAYAIYGFSGWTRTRSDIYRIKRFEEAYDETVRARIAAVEAKDYTRMGVAIRHLTQLLLRQPARHRLLVTLSDGRPDDFGDEYRGHYGIEDTRRALQEAHEQGVKSYCITIDRHGADYLAHMYGAARFTVLDDVKKLPLKIADIYRRLST